MLKNKSRNFISWFLLSLVLFGFGSAAVADCIPVKGKILNNGFLDEFGSTKFTLGVVAMNFNSGEFKFKCGLLGVPKLADDEGDGELNFDHTISCDDDVDVLGLPGHSRLEFDTTGDTILDPPPPFCVASGEFFSFIESAQPVPGTGTGRFAGVVNGELIVEGTVFCNLAIDMKFVGELCY